MKYLALLCLVVLGTGCVRGRVSYGVHPLASETIPGELNAEWFARNIYGSLETVDKKRPPSRLPRPNCGRARLLPNRQRRCRARLPFNSSLGSRHKRLLGGVR